MAAIETTGLTHRFGRLVALRKVDLAVPEGSLFALLGPNGAGKSTLLQLVLGLRHASVGRATVFGRDSRALRARDRQSIGYVADGQELPPQLTLGQTEAFLAPLYESWDDALATELRTRFSLDPTRRVGTLSRGERMKAALLCALAPRPRLLVMDEPFNGIDVGVKDELVRGLLASASADGATILISSHDLAELEMLADTVGFLDGGRLLYADTMESMRERYVRVEVQADTELAGVTLPSDWRSVERAGARAAFVMQHDGEEPVEVAVRRRIPGAVRIKGRPATLREVFLALTRPRSADATARTTPALESV